VVGWPEHGDRNQEVLSSSLHSGTSWQLWLCAFVFLGDEAFDSRTSFMFFQQSLTTAVLAQEGWEAGGVVPCEAPNNLSEKRLGLGTFCFVFSGGTEHRSWGAHFCISKEIRNSSTKEDEVG
jgi:hypothetical protein